MSAGATGEGLPIGGFPPGFVWGAATSAYQIEGAVAEDSRGESIWDRFSRAPGRIAGGDRADVACDHYHRWEADIRLMSQLGINAYRFSVAWPRVIPGGWGRRNEQGISFYERLVDGLIAANITPWVTLYHWDLPQRLEDAGGWPARSTAEAFAEYAELVSRRLGDRVKHWITLNEPWCSAFLGYHQGVHAPGRRSLADALKAAHVLLLGHGMALEVIRGNCSGAGVGLALNPVKVYPLSDSSEDQEAVEITEGCQNRWFLDPLYGRGYPADMVERFGDAAPEWETKDLEVISRETDFLGLNYYTANTVRGGAAGSFLGVERLPIPEADTMVNGWSVYPLGLTDIVRELAEWYPVSSIYLTENGAAFSDRPDESGTVDDLPRVRYLARHLLALRQAAVGGAPVKGYFAWSLMDNFEWTEGYRVRFGLSYVDYETQERTIKASGHWYRQVAESNQMLLPEGVEER